MATQHVVGSDVLHDAGLVLDVDIAGHQFNVDEVQLGEGEDGLSAEMGTRRPGSPVEKRSRLLTRGKPSMGVSLQLGEGVLPPTMKLRRVAVCWQVGCRKSSGFPAGGGPIPVGEGEFLLKACHSGVGKFMVPRSWFWVLRSVEVS